jgi:hypothetical protein
LIATADALLTYLADLVESIERLAVTVLPPNDAAEIALGRESDGSLLIDLDCRPPQVPGPADAQIEIVERWRRTRVDRYERADYKFEIRHRALQYRRAFHRHDAERFLRAHNVATHEHCEVTLGNPVCDHFAGDPVVDAMDGFQRLYALWLTGEKPDCAALSCLG